MKASTFGYPRVRFGGWTAGLGRPLAIRVMRRVNGGCWPLARITHSGLCCSRWCWRPL